MNRVLDLLQFYLHTLNNNEDKSKFEKLYYINKNAMLNHAFSILKDSSLAEDAVHNAFLRILKNIDKIIDPDDMKSRGYCIVVVENVAKTMYNKEHKIKLIEFEDKEADISIEQIAEDDLFIEKLTSIIGELPEIYCHVIILKFFNELSDKEISSTLNVPISTVRKRLLRGKKLLKKKLVEVNRND